MAYGWNQNWSGEYPSKQTAKSQKPKPNLRGFNPAAVKIEHIKKLTVLYGDDIAGIDIRLDRFAEVLSENGINADIVADADDMLNILHAAGLFAPAVACICRDGIDFVKTSSVTKGKNGKTVKTSTNHRLKELSNLVSTLPDGSYVIIGIQNPKSSKKIEELENIVSSVGGVMREVSLPYETAKWLIEYAKSVGVEIDMQKSVDILEACDNDTKRSAVLIDMFGEEILQMDKPSIALIASNYGKSKRQLPNIINPIAYKDIDTLVSIRRSLPEGRSGDRTFILRIASAVDELLHASLDTSHNAVWFSKTNAARWNSGKPYYETRKRSMANSTGGVKRYAALHSYLMARTLALYGFGDGVIATLADLMSHIAE